MLHRRVFDFVRIACFASAAVGLSTGLQSARAADEVHIVSPAGLENVEGDTSANPEFDSVPFHVQLIYPASDFAALPQTHRLLTGIAARPDVSITEPHMVNWPDVALYVMTTSADPSTASLTFADNWGEDRQLVLTGPISFSTEATGPAEGPRPFDYSVSFDRPFRYDPEDGNLLLEFVSSTGYSPPLTDDYHAAASGTWLGIAFDPAATMAENSGPQVSVLRFTFIPEPSTCGILCISAVLGAIILRRSSGRPITRSQPFPSNGPR